MGYRAIGLSGCRAIGLSGCRCSSPCVLPTLALPVLQHRLFAHTLSIPHNKTPCNRSLIQSPPHLRNTLLIPLTTNTKPLTKHCNKSKGTFATHRCCYNNCSLPISPQKPPPPAQAQRPLFSVRPSRFSSLKYSMMLTLDSVSVRGSPRYGFQAQRTASRNKVMAPMAQSDNHNTTWNIRRITSTNLLEEGGHSWRSHTNWPTVVRILDTSLQPRSTRWRCYLLLPPLTIGGIEFLAVSREWTPLPLVEKASQCRGHRCI